MQNNKYMVIEHMEDFLYDWSKQEYLQILKYTANSTFQTILSNYKVISEFKGDQQDELDNTNNIQELKLANQNAKNPILFSDAMVQQMDELEDNKMKIEYDNGKLEVDCERVCLLDLRAEKVLSPEDQTQFDVFIFGGILGDHPPRDRTKGLRKQHFQMRHLGDLQLSTDTALLVTKLIIENQRQFDSLPFVDEPAVKDETNDQQIDLQFQLEGFRYLKKVYDFDKNDIDTSIQTNEFLMNEKIKDDYLKRDLDFNMM